VLIQVGIHQIDNLQYLLGPATSVNARFAFGELGPRMPDTAVVMMTHANGALSTVTSSWTTPGHYRLDLQATAGNLVFSLDHGHWTSGDIDDHGELSLEPLEGIAGPYPTEKGDPLRAQLEELGRAARDGTPMEIGVEDGLRAMAVVQAAVNSARENGAPMDLAVMLAETGATETEINHLLGARRPPR
jgi:UDP-N-acetyl-2-amino-2-deoxyglucuronate dehydrogenase